tara:strand:+ start:14974 stop:15678 length:705 start_codon:yes stop_codon:yes gene_type:complete
MYLDLLNYQNFYKSSIGNLLARHIEFKFKKYCYLHNKQNIGCFGYSLPYLTFLKNYNLSLTYCYLKKMGLPSENISKTNKILIDEDRIPFKDSFFDHLFLVHYLENTIDLKLSLREIWRTLVPEGNLYLIIPNKKSSWYLSDKSPFSSGRGFSKKQIRDLLNDSFFEIQKIERIVYFPNKNYLFINKYKNFIDQIGSILFKYFNGVYLCIVKKKIYANVISQTKSKKSLIKSII